MVHYGASAPRCHWPPVFRAGDGHQAWTVLPRQRNQRRYVSTLRNEDTTNALKLLYLTSKLSRLRETDQRGRCPPGPSARWHRPGVSAARSPGRPLPPLGHEQAGAVSGLDERHDLSFRRSRRVIDPWRSAGSGARRASRAPVVVLRRGHYGYRASSVVVRRPVAMSYTWPETLILGESKGEVSRRSTSALTVVCGSATAEASSAVSGRPVASAAWCRKPGSARKPVPHWVWWMTATSKSLSSASWPPNNCPAR